MDMRITCLLLLIVVGGFPFIGGIFTNAPAGPPIDIRIDGSLEPALEQRIRSIRAEHPSLDRHRTRGFEILSDLDDDVVAEHGQLLERTVRAVDEFCLALGYPPGESLGSSSDHRHLVIAFSNRDAFIEFAARRDRVNARWLGGYFAPGPGYLVYHTVADHPDVRKMTKDLVAPDGEAGDTSGTDDRLHRFVIEADASVVVHEATHMLLHHRGVAPATNGQSMWLLEGLAGSFEPIEATRRFGPMRPENARTRDFRDLLRRGRVPRLVDLVRERDFPGARGTTHVHYATSAALCSWLARHRAEELRRYLDTVNARVGGRSGDRDTTSLDAHQGGGEEDIDGRLGARRLAEFESVFGEVSRLEYAWLRYEMATASMTVEDREMFVSRD